MHFAVARQVLLVAYGECLELLFGSDTENLLISRADLISNQESSLVVKGDESTIEKTIDMGGQKKSVVGIEARAVVAEAPGLNVRCNQQLGVAQASKGALVVPSLEQRLAKRPLPYARLYNRITGSLANLLAVCAFVYKSGHENGAQFAPVQEIEAGIRGQTCHVYLVKPVFLIDDCRRRARAELGSKRACEGRHV